MVPNRVRWVVEFLTQGIILFFSSRHESYYSYDDDHDLGEVGDTADVACDFGGDFGGF